MAVYHKTARELLGPDGTGQPAPTLQAFPQALARYTASTSENR